ncbi:chromate efflux transporter [Halopseudomonas sp.]|uniref:chromate efflux transporter n=1 Tax=Halopseudomonas sp. TaxID=2901191 RepID=UPI003002B52C
MTTIPFGEAISVWWRIGVLSFGGPAGQIALMHRILVEEKGWVDEARFLHALNYCMLLPGPEAQQLATYVGWLLHGVRGGLVAGLLFILPGAVAILALSWLYVLLGDLAVVEGLFFGLKAAVLAIVAQALLRIAGRALQGLLKPLLALAAFTALFVFSLPFPLVVIGAGLIGYVGARFFSPADASAAVPLAPVTVRPGTRTAAITCLLLWLGTVGGLVLLLGPDNVFAQISVFFAKMALITFGGAYAVLSYVAQQGVEHYQWLQPGEMLDGLAMAETTPGPLILVTQFVGFLAGFREGLPQPGLLTATAGALLTLWVTFLPCFVWIFAGAPHVEKLRGHRALSSALAAITAAVVGVIANLALWFALNALFTEQIRVTNHGIDLLLPQLDSLDGPLLAIAVIACVLVFVVRIGILPLLGLCAGLGVAWTWLATTL